MYGKGNEVLLKAGDLLKNSGKLIIFTKTAVSVVLLITAAACLCRRLPQCFGTDEPAALAAALTLTNGTYRFEKMSQKETQAQEQTEETTSPAPTKVRNVSKRNEKKDKDGYYDTYADHEGEEKYDIVAQQFGETGVMCGNGYIKNNMGIDMDFDSLLEEKLPFEMKKTDSPQVLIYHTHTSESYMDEDVDYYYESYYSRTQNTDYNVTSVGEILAETLTEKGITTLHDSTVHDSTYSGSYDRSMQTIQSIMEHNEDIKVVIDIHRDAIGSDTYKVKPVFEYDGRQGAQIMLMSGCDIDGEMGFDTWEENLNFALKIQNQAEKMYPGMTRPLTFGYFAYNEYLCNGSLLIEVGTDANTIEEAEYTAELLGNVLYEVLKK